MEKSKHMQYGAALMLLFTVVIALNFAFATITHADTKGVGVFIGTNGNAYVHGATVTATSTSGITATTNLAGNTILWNVNSSSTTRFGKLGKGFISLTQIAIGDVVSFFGKVSGSGSNLTVDAVIKDKTRSTSTPAKINNAKNHESFRHAFKRFYDNHPGLKARLDARAEAKSH